MGYLRGTYFACVSSVLMAMRRAWAVSRRGAVAPASSRFSTAAGRDDVCIDKALSRGNASDAGDLLLAARKRGDDFCARTHRNVLEALVSQQQWPTLAKVVTDFVVADWHAIGTRYWHSTLWACALAGKGRWIQCTT